MPSTLKGYVMALDGFDDLLLRFFDAALFSSLLGLELAEGAAPQAEGFGAARRDGRERWWLEPSERSGGARGAGGGVGSVHVSVSCDF